jgi:hypothetical protein
VRIQRHALAALYPRERPVTHCKEAVWAPGPVWTGAENLAPTGIRSPDLPARSQSLYRLSYPAHVSFFYKAHFHDCLNSTAMDITLNFDTEITFQVTIHIFVHFTSALIVVCVCVWGGGGSGSRILISVTCRDHSVITIRKYTCRYGMAATATFRHVRKIPKRDYQLRRVSLSVCTSVCPSVRVERFGSTGRILMKFDFLAFLESLSRN